MSLWIMAAVCGAGLAIAVPPWSARGRTEAWSFAVCWTIACAFTAYVESGGSLAFLTEHAVALLHRILPVALTSYR